LREAASAMRCDAMRCGYNNNNDNKSEKLHSYYFPVGLIFNADLRLSSGDENDLSFHCAFPPV